MTKEEYYAQRHQRDLDEQEEKENEETCDYCGEPFSYSDGGDGEYEVSHNGCWQALKSNV